MNSGFDFVIIENESILVKDNVLYIPYTLVHKIH